MRNLIRGLLGFVITGVCSGLAGCSSQPHDSDDSEYRTFDQLVDKALTDARDGGASNEQISELELATETGLLTLEVMRQATQRTVDCVAEYGEEIEYGESTDWSGFVLPYYVVEENSISLESCETAEYFWVSYVYQLQPSRFKAADALLDGHVDELRSCLEDAGHEVSALQGRELAGLAEAVQHGGPGAPNCLKVAGVESDDQ